MEPPVVHHVPTTPSRTDLAMTTLIVLRLLHIVTGILWGGTVIFMTFYLMPALKAAGPGAAGPVMAGLMQRRFMTVLPLVALVTVLSGLALVWVASNGQVGAYVQTSSGQLFTSAGGLAILAFVIGTTVSRPAALGAARLMAGLATIADPAERDRAASRAAALQRRSLVASQVIAVLILLAMMGMAVARYV